MTPLRLVKLLVFFLLLPVYAPAYLLLHFTFKGYSSLVDK
jgi:hypothetical protein